MICKIGIPTECVKQCPFWKSERFMEQCELYELLNEIYMDSKRVSMRNTFVGRILNK